MAKRTKRTNRAYGLRNALQKLSPLPILASRDPRTTDLSVPIGTDWINENTNDVWKLTSVLAGSANWEPIGQDTSGSAPITKYVVDPDGTGDYTTIQAALDAANTAGIAATLYVRPGTYTENLTLYDQIDIWGAVGVGDTGTCILNGTHTPPASGVFTIRNIRLQSATDIFNSAVAGTTSLIVMDCQIDVTNGYVFNLVNWTGTFSYFDVGSISTNDGVVNNTNGATVFMTDATIGAGLGNTMTVSGNTVLFNVHAQCPITIQGAGVTTINGGSWLNNTLTTAVTAIVGITNSNIATAGNAAINHGSAGTLNISDTSINSSNNPAIIGAGAGAVLISGVNFLTNSLIAGTLTFSNTGRTSTGGLKIVEGANATSGIATLVAGAVTVNTTAVTANSRIYLMHQVLGGTAGFLVVFSRIAGTSFNIQSSNAADTSDIGWLIVEPQ